MLSNHADHRDDESVEVFAKTEKEATEHDEVQRALSSNRFSIGRVLRKSELKGNYWFGR